MEFRRPGNGRTTPTRALVFLRDLSPRGAGMTCESPCSIPIEPESVVVLHFPLGGRDISLPARIKWVEPRGDGAVAFGVHLQLELASAKSRHTYADWIVAKVQALVAERYGEEADY